MSETEEVTCAVCLEIIDENYGTTDHPDDSKAKCCVQCIKQVVDKNKTSLISRKPVTSYTIYSKNGEVIEKVHVIEPNVEHIPEISIIINQNDDNNNNYQIPNIIINQNGENNNYQIPNIVINQNGGNNQVIYQAVQDYNLILQQQQNHNAQVERKWKIRKTISAVLAGCIFIVFLALFAAFMVIDPYGNTRFIMLGISGSALVLGIIFHGIMDCRVITEKV